MFRRRFLLINSRLVLLAPVLLLWVAFAQQPQSSKPDFGELEKVALADRPSVAEPYCRLEGRRHDVWPPRRQ
jgi:hypothetical protein